MSIYFRYIRNLSLLDRRLTPDLYTLIVAAKQTAGDDFALALAETARSYPCGPAEPDGESSGFDPDEIRVCADGNPPGRAARSGAPARWSAGCRAMRLSWRTCELRPKPEKDEQTRWRQRWDPFGMCSWPPEDDRIESFHRHVRDQAKAIMGADLARTEKFTTSVRDGIDIRETLRNWHTGELYVKVVPPSRGTIEVVVFLFDLPADPEVYTNRTTWYAEHTEESTLSLLCDGPDEEPGRPGDRPGRVRRGTLHLPTPADSRRLDRQAARLYRHTGRAAARRGLLAQQRPARRGRQPQGSLRRAGAGWPGDSAARSSTCR